ncbi:MAG: efflux RND transporter periplasmic adaptor subunit [Flavobacteriales bacterium]|nr:efflux RND transporter periplasmic adaptor subunit [Flavobacteriales bacterium]
MNKGCLTALIVFVIIVVLGAIGTIFYLYNKEKGTEQQYDTIIPHFQTITLKSVATGSVEPRKEIEIKPQISGIIKEMYVEAGDTVAEGDAIAKVKVIPDMVSLNNAENRVERARIALENAQMDYDRNKKLLDQGVVAQADFQQFDTALKSAREENEAATDNLEIVREGVARRSGSGSSNTIVRATISGMVLNVPVEEGNSVIESNNFNDGTTIASIADMGDLIFKGNIDESEVEKLHNGMSLIVTIGAIENRTFDAVLEYISPKGADVNGAIQFEIRAAIQLREGEFIRAGYSANADVVLDSRENVLAISEEGLQYDKDKKPFVEVLVGDNKWERRDVTLGLSDGIYVEILDGVTKDDQIKKWNVGGQ